MGLGSKKIISTVKLPTYALDLDTRKAIFGILSSERGDGFSFAPGGNMVLFSELQAHLTKLLGTNPMAVVLENPTRESSKWLRDNQALVLHGLSAASK